MPGRDAARRAAAAALLVAGVTAAGGCTGPAGGGRAPAGAPTVAAETGCPGERAASGAFSAAAPRGWRVRATGDDAAAAPYRPELAFGPAADGGPDAPVLTVRSRAGGGTTITTAVSRIVAERRRDGHDLLGPPQPLELDRAPAALFVTVDRSGAQPVDHLQLAARHDGRTYLAVLVTPAAAADVQLDRLREVAGSWCWA